MWIGVWIVLSPVALERYGDEAVGLYVLVGAAVLVCEVLWRRRRR